ncbi:MULTISPECIES: CDP-diacylglycerol--serine O-phosphatidyltransferase [Acinetobacter]|jgi:CDP-diacylglycerol--serine O-phosphatidyltransferase|uniref:CDP-diacylglycerol--serine O-phosphatidyltransferase n=2 Tax=Acinetobacter johnsonii TaxID=40214 RepID=A0A2W5R862_ACIJO|nr:MULTISPECIES: CDP-diacylglycerol--serine O-phosphatidyltransferase [Acinetobacter]ENV74022.1 CDP-diacylglycerol-serine O-phosphatidyltransferase [Acinetobacter johnsonii ANC 3681]MBK5647628.1 CDP-diacylglycerol--serine O-phosphatidyltransferase [Acinetobacter sp.]MBO7706494.1 CDP-diacylglycerol--serine O-phosphatidyltransferase [Acinetobacter sp.]MDH1240234.1 CDP-diacylglycerol--serine O-phosphatidyltransferase [Acinetobacter johnsonii]MDH1439560.1 CDP-diacylglycerol--serine O-phosphatidylt
MTNINKPESESSPRSTPTFDGITFEVEEEEHTQEGQKVKRRGIYLWPNLITTAALLSGFYSIIASMNGNFQQAIYAIFLAALLDGLDGRVARAIGAQSAFGEQYDSLSDLLAFGVAPAILMYSWSLDSLGRIGLACCFVYTACAAFRLARFNVQIGVVDKRYFIGVASPLAAIIIISLVWVGLDFPEIFDIRERGIQAISAAVIVSVGLLMISNIKYYSFKTVDRKRVPFFVLPIAVFIFAAITYNIPVGILVISLIYALSGFITTFLARRQHSPS